MLNIVSTKVYFTLFVSYLSLVLFRLLLLITRTLHVASVEKTTWVVVFSRLRYHNILSSLFWVFSCKNSLLVLQNFTIARKSWNILVAYWKAFFVRQSSEYETSDKDRKVNRNGQMRMDSRDITNTASSWPYGWPMGTYSSLFTWRVQGRNKKSSLSPLDSSITQH